MSVLDAVLVVVALVAAVGFVIWYDERTQDRDGIQELLKKNTTERPTRKEQEPPAWKSKLRTVVREGENGRIKRRG